MKLPELTDLQYAVISIIGTSEVRGEDVRSSMGDVKLPAFYRLMSRMEKAKWVKGRYVVSVVNGQSIKERLYTVTALGKVLAKEKRDFINKR